MWFHFVAISGSAMRHSALSWPLTRRAYLAHTLALAACQKKEDVAAGPAEQAGQQIDAAAAKAQAREQLRRFMAPGRGYVPVGAKLYRD